MGSQGVSRSATYLPEIAEREGWSKLEAIESLVRKSGWDGVVTPSTLVCTRYQSTLSSMTYSTYTANRGRATATAAVAGPGPES